MDRKRALSLYYKIVFGALALSSYVLVASVLAFRPEAEPVGTLTSMVRLPASIPSVLDLPEINFTAPAKKPDQLKVETLALSCWENSSAQHQSIVQSTTAKWVRLTGRACTGNWTADSWKVFNQSNGFSATVFEPSPRQMTTDFIPLQAGENRIRLVALSSAGVPLEVFVSVERK